MSNPVRSRITIKQVAAASGVATSTVSNALTGKGYVAPETRSRVMETAASLGYRASSLARSLRLQQTWSVGLLLADVSNPFFPAVVRGVEDVLWGKAYNLVLCNTDYRKDKEAAYLRHLLDKRLDGLILASTASDSDDVLRLQAERVPFVMLNRRHVSAKTHYVGMDNEGGVGMAMEHLLALGHRRIGFIKGRADSSAAEERYQGYLKALRQARIPFDEALVAYGDYTIEFGSCGGRRLDGPPPIADGDRLGQRLHGVRRHGPLQGAGPARARGDVGHRLRRYLRVGAALDRAHDGAAAILATGRQRGGAVAGSDRRAGDRPRARDDPAERVDPARDHRAGESERIDREENKL